MHKNIERTRNIINQQNKKNEKEIDIINFLKGRNIKVPKYVITVHIKKMACTNPLNITKIFPFYHPFYHTYILVFTANLEKTLENKKKIELNNRVHPEPLGWLQSLNNLHFLL